MALHTVHSVQQEEVLADAPSSNAQDSNMSKGIVDIVCKDVLNVLEDKKALDIVTIPLMGKTSIADYMIIASGTSTQHIAALAFYAQKELLKNNVSSNVEGKKGNKWVLLDAG